MQLDDGFSIHIYLSLAVCYWFTFVTINSENNHLKITNTFFCSELLFSTHNVDNQVLYVNCVLPKS
jgi:hypothetical protein